MKWQKFVILDFGYLARASPVLLVFCCREWSGQDLSLPSACVSTARDDFAFCCSRYSEQGLSELGKTLAS